MIHVHYTATCHACDWTHDGPDSHKAAEKHTKASGHATETRGTPG